MSHVKKFHPQWLVWVGLIALLAYQAWLFYFRMPLSLGPRVIFEPWALRNGYFIYENITDLHSPLMPWLLAALGTIVPNGLRLAKLTLVGLLSLSTLFTFLVARRHSGVWAGLAAAALFVLWAPAIGFGKLWYEAFLAPAYLVYLLAYKSSVQPRTYKWRVFWGLFGGVTVLIKQHAALVFAAFLIWEGITALANKRPRKTILRDLIVTGSISFFPVALAIGYQYLSTGSVESLIYWLVTYPLDPYYRELASKTITDRQITLLIGAAFMLPAAVIMTWAQFRKKDDAWKQIGLWMLVLVSGAFMVYPRFEIYHLQPILAVMTLISVWCLTTILRQPSSNALHRTFSVGISVSYVVSCISLVIAGHISAIASNKPRFISEYTPLEPLAAQIAPLLGPNEELFIFLDDESTSNLYYLLKESPPTYWIFHYPWYMMPEVKANIMENIEAHSPDWVVYRPARWQTEVYFPEMLEYLNTHYQKEADLIYSEGEIHLLRRIHPH